MADLQPITHLIVLYLVGEQVPRAGRACAIRVRQGLPIWPCPPPSLTFSVWQGSGGNLICVISACVWVSRVPVSDRTMPNFAEPCPNPRDQTCIQDLQFMSMPLPLPPATPQEARPGATSTPMMGDGFDEGFRAERRRAGDAEESLPGLRRDVLAALCLCFLRAVAPSSSSEFAPGVRAR